MDGPQDLGGRLGFGPVDPEPDEPLFHADWEARAMAITVACGALGHWTLDESRHMRESLPARDYLSFSYYKIWITGLEALLARHGEVTPQERATGVSARPGRHADRCLTQDRVAAVLSSGGPTSRETDRPARYRVGDAVRTRNHNPVGHTRLPSYARLKPGVIEAVHTPHVYPDTNAHGQGEAPEWLYTVAFAAPDLYGTGADPTLTVTIDAWESYLDPA